MDSVRPTERGSDDVTSYGEAAGSGNPDHKLWGSLQQPGSAGNTKPVAGKHEAAAHVMWIDE
jgi:hypothetical protein